MNSTVIPRRHRFVRGVVSRGNKGVWPVKDGERLRLFKELPMWVRFGDMAAEHEAIAGFMYR